MSDMESVKKSLLVSESQFDFALLKDLNTSQFVTGQCWLQVAPPGNTAATDSRIRSVSLGGPTGNHVWAVDAANRLHIRKEVSVVYPEGTSWLQVRNPARR